MHMHLYKRDWRLHLPVADAVFQQKMKIKIQTILSCLHSWICSNKL